MEYILHLTAEQVKIISKACEALSNIHIGKLSALADIPEINEEEDLESFRDALMMIEPYIVDDQCDGRTCPLTKASNEAKISHDLYEIIRSAMLPAPDGELKLLSGKVTAAQLTFISDAVKPLHSEGMFAL